MIDMHRRKQRPRTTGTPIDCTCDGNHTQAVDPHVDDTALRLLIGLAECPAEKRALNRILAQREYNLGG